MIGIKDQYFGTEIEMTGITRQRAAEVVAEMFGTEAYYDGTVYMICWTEWKRKPELKSHPTCYVTILQICESRQDGNWK